MGLNMHIIIEHAVSNIQKEAVILRVKNMMIAYNTLSYIEYKWLFPKRK